MDENNSALDEEEEYTEEDALEIIEISDKEDGEDLADDIDDLGLDEDASVKVSAEMMDGQEDYKDDSTILFGKHSASVFSVSLHPANNSLVVSGGEDDKAYVWKTNDGDLAFECTGHKDSVTCTGFSYDGKYIATADMSGVVHVWAADTGQKVWSFECDDIEWLRWHHGAQVLIVGTTTGEVWMWKMPGGDCRTFASDGFKSSCGKILNNGKMLCVGYENGAVRLWDLKSGSSLFHLADGTSHEGSITSVDVNQDDTLILSGSEDATAKLVNAASGKVIATFPAGFSDEQNPENNPSVESVGFSSNLPLAATGCLNGVLGVWDIPTQRLRQQCKHNGGIVKLEWDHMAPLVYTACLDGVIRLWDARSGNCEREWEGHTGELLDFTLSRDGSMIVSCSEDSTARIFKTEFLER